MRCQPARSRHRTLCDQFAPPRSATGQFMHQRTGAHGGCRACRHPAGCGARNAAKARPCTSAEGHHPAHLHLSRQSAQQAFRQQGLHVSQGLAGELLLRRIETGGIELQPISRMGGRDESSHATAIHPHRPLASVEPSHARLLLRSGCRASSRAWLGSAESDGAEVMQPASTRQQRAGQFQVALLLCGSALLAQVDQRGLQAGADLAVAGDERSGIVARGLPPVVARAAARGTGGGTGRRTGRGASEAGSEAGQRQGQQGEQQKRTGHRFEAGCEGAWSVTGT